MIWRLCLSQATMPRRNNRYHSVMHALTTVHSGLEHREGGSFLPRHMHASAYAAVVLSGEYEECGSRGRFRVRAGDVLIHGAFDAHLDRFATRGAAILNLPLSAAATTGSGGRLEDVDAIVRAAQFDQRAAVEMMLTQMHAISPTCSDWPDLLASDLLGDPHCRLDRWAYAHGMVPETLSRGFTQVFGTPPARFRSEARVRRALKHLVQSELPFVEIAALEGFSDQAHMTRAVRALTGSPPGAWRGRATRELAG